MTFEAAIRLLGRTLRPLPEPLRVAAPVQLAPQSGPAGLGQIPSWWQAPLNDWGGWFPACPLTRTDATKPDLQTDRAVWLVVRSTVLDELTTNFFVPNDLSRCKGAIRCVGHHSQHRAKRPSMLALYGEERAQLFRIALSSQMWNVSH